MTDYHEIGQRFDDSDQAETHHDPIVACGLSDLQNGDDLVGIEQCLRRLGTILIDADGLGRSMQRNRAVAELRRLSVASPAQLVDAAIARQNDKPGAAANQGKVIAFPAFEPWPDPVDGTELLTDLEFTLARFLAMPDGTPATVVLWILFAHTHSSFVISPILAITSPEKRCGKSTLLELLAALLPRPLPASNVTPSVLFRSLEKFAPTLLIDEADTFLNGNPELRGVLNSGHRLHSAYVLRTVGDDFEPRVFRTWGPKAIGCIGELPDTLNDRSVVVRMKRRRVDEPVEEMRLDRLPELQPLLRRAIRWAADNVEALKAADPVMPKGVHNRAADNWRPLLAIADAVGGVWPNRARETARIMCEVADEDPAPGELLLADIVALFEKEGVVRLQSADVLAYLVSLEDRPWAEWLHGRPLTIRQLAILLSAFAIKPRPMRFGDRILRGYELSDFTDAVSRYTQSNPQHPQHPQHPNGDSANTARDIGFVADVAGVALELELAAQSSASDEDATERAAIVDEGQL